MEGRRRKWRMRRREERCESGGGLKEMVEMEEGRKGRRWRKERRERIEERSK